MRVLMLSKALVHGVYQRKCEEIAALGVDLTVAVPHTWREPRVGEQRLERQFTSGYRLEALPILFNGQHHAHVYPTLGRLMREVRPEVVHIDEEAFNPAAAHAMWLAVRAGARSCFFNWANIARSYPPPFSLFERYVYRHAAHAICGNQEAAAIVRAHGYGGPLSVVPQFGVDPALFALAPIPPAGAPFVVGYLGRLVPEKGVVDLVEALPLTPPHVRLRIIGDGPERAALLQRADDLGVGTRVDLRPLLPSAAVPGALLALSALALPSRTTPGWKEQFGRVLVEAMSCGVPVIGSSSGEIPHVVADAGLIVAEGDVLAWGAAITRLAHDARLCADLRVRGRQRALDHYTMAAVARATVDVYRAMVGRA